MINLLEEFVKYLSSVGLNKFTIRNYFADLNKFFHWFEINTGHKLTPESFHPSHISAYLADLEKSNVPQTTVNRYFTSIKRFSNWLKPSSDINLIPIPSAVQSGINISPQKDNDGNLFERYSQYLKNKRIFHCQFL